LTSCLGFNQIGPKPANPGAVRPTGRLTLMVGREDRGSAMTPAALLPSESIVIGYGQQTALSIA
jgi:hypothetical protein